MRTASASASVSRRAGWAFRRRFLRFSKPAGAIGPIRGDHTCSSPRTSKPWSATEAGKALLLTGNAELGYAVAPSRQRRDIATAVVRELVCRARDTGLRTVVAHTLADESASTRVLTKSGFVRVAESVDPVHGRIWRWELSSTWCLRPGCSRLSRPAPPSRPGEAVELAGPNQRLRKRPRRITAVSRILGTRGLQTVTRGQEGTGTRVQEASCGVGGTRVDTQSRRFGTVRPRVQIPAPDHVFEFKTQCWRLGRCRFWPRRAQRGHIVPIPYAAPQAYARHRCLRLSASSMRYLPYARL